MDRQGDPLGIVQEVQIWPYEKVVYALAGIRSGEWDAQTSLGLWDTNRSSNLGQTTRPCDSQQKKRTCWIADFTVPADHSVKLKKGEKRDKYLDLTRELKKLWNMKVTVIPMVVDALGKIPKGLVKGLEDLEIRGQVESIQTTTLLRSVRILSEEEFWRLEETCCHSNSCQRTSANAGMKNS